MLVDRQQLVIALKREIAHLKAELRTMQRSPEAQRTAILQACTVAAPDTLSAVVEARKAQGLL
jgi:hypothetical protein